MKPFMALWLLCPLMWAGGEVLNGTTPKQKHSLELVEDLRFGGDEESDIMLWVDSRTKILPDARGHMYIADPRENRIIEFDKSGAYVRTVSVPGQGPGQLQGIKGLSLLKTGEAILLDGPIFGLPKLKYYDESMAMKHEEFVPANSPIGVPQAMWFSNDGHSAAGNFVALKKDAKNTVVMISAVVDMKKKGLKKILLQKERPNIDMTRFREGAYWSDYIALSLQIIYKGFGVMSFDDKGRVYTAISTDYEVTRWDPDMKKTELVIKRKYKPIANNEAHLEAILDVLLETFTNISMMQDVLTESVLAAALKKSDPPPAKSPIFGIIPIEDQGVLVVHDLDLATRMTVGDIFSNDGDYIGQIKVPDFGLMTADGGQFLPRMVFKNGYAYTLETDDEDNIEAVRYKYRLKKI